MITTAPTSAVSVLSPVAAPVSFSVAATGPGDLAYQWRFNGVDISGATASSFTIYPVRPADAGAYTVVVSNTLGGVASPPALLGVSSSVKVFGQGYEFAANIKHPSGNVYDQVLLTGPAATVTADPGQVTRVSFVDLTDDIVQVEFSGPGTLTIVLDYPTGPAPASKYNQPTVAYMKGHATLMISGAEENTHISAFTVGTMTAVNQSLFKAGESYDGVADLARLTILSATGRFGGIRMANTGFFSLIGTTGINAPDIGFAGPVNVHNISAFGSASPVLLTGSIDTGKINITGGDLLQINDRGVQIDLVEHIVMSAGTSSHGVPQPAQVNRSRIIRGLNDVTTQVIQNP